MNYEHSIANLYLHFFAMVVKIAGKPVVHEIHERTIGAIYAMVTDMRRGSAPMEIACQQVVAEDSSVSSIQWMIVPARYAALLTPELLLERYFRYIRQATFSPVRPAATGEGVDFRLFATSARILTFTSPALLANGNARTVSLAIRGGLLVQRDQCHRGQLSITCEGCAEGVKVTLHLSDYCPLILGSDRTSALRKWLYRFTQAYIHKRVITRFLGRLYRDVAGKDACTKVVKVRALAGEDI